MPRNQGNTGDNSTGPQFKEPNTHPWGCQTELPKNLDAKHKTINQEVRGLHSTQSQTHVGKLKTLEIGTLHFKNVQVSCIDLSHVNQALTQHKAQAVQGIIGADVLLQGHAVIDYYHRCVYLQ